ncbi:MAG TPA: hypothetical protein VNM90_13570 [Haliangium sp.]|nr:hypothetical protein [Haliangium sp.]
MCTAMALGACADDPALDTERSGLSSSNRLALNRLALNRLALNRLALNSLALSKLAMTELERTRWQLVDSPELLGTEAGREVLKYVVQCALDPEDIMVGTTGGQTYEFPGLLGLAPQWRNRHLRQSEQELISACLLSHVNAYGMPIPISLRSERALAATEEERRDYPVYEGTFFGQIFEGGMTRAYTCQGSAVEAAMAHSEDRAMRVCTNSTEQCGIVSVGRCRDVCETRTEDMGWSDCWAEGKRYERTVSVYLFADDAYGLNKRCTSKGCNMATSGGTAAILDCNGTRRCSASCTNGATCTVDGVESDYVEVAVNGAHMGEVDCYDGHDCTVACSNGSSCDVECQDGNDCDVDCSGGASCEVDCYRSKDCDVECSEGATCHVQCGGGGMRSCDGIECRAGSTCTLECRSPWGCEIARCEQGASCLLKCRNGNRCKFDYCAGGATSCGNGVVACGRPCP